MGQHLHGFGGGVIPGAALAAALLAPGCAPVEPAPEDVDGLFHYFWLKASPEAGSDEELLMAAANAHAAVEGDTLEERFDGALSDLGREHLDAVGIPGHMDPAVNAGFFLVGVLPCTLDQVERIVSDLRQDELYPGNYESYQRSYTSDADAYFAGEVPVLTFTTEIEAEFLPGAPYFETVLGELRRVPADEGADLPGPVLVARYHIPEPAVFEDAGFFFEQDYQVEVYWERAPGEVIHAYGIWRHMGDATLTTDDEFVVRIILDNLGDWDDRTGEICAED
ncbi:hypothetical protein L6R50_05675 [Myxococcota bacterium]|nr:hypothetical protein [Myxococcota bacterium]